MFQKDLPVRFIVKNISTGLDHIQCQVFMGGEWHWSMQDGGIISLGPEEYPGNKTVKILTYSDLLKERLAKVK